MNSNQQRFLVLSFLAVGFTISCGLTKTADVDIVRNGVLADYSTTTVGKAFEGTFQNAKWTSLETPKGQRIVQFDGTILWNTMNNGRTVPYESLPQSVKEQCIASLGITETPTKLHERARELWGVKDSSPAAKAEWDQISPRLQEVEGRIGECVKGLTIPVKFQFVLSADAKAFRLEYVDEVFGTQQRALAFIYR
jgi:hypothetical protein